MASSITREFGLEAAIHLVAALTLASGLVVARVMGTPAPVSRPA